MNDTHSAQATADDAPARDPREIERDLDQTRDRMSNTLDALQNKLSFGQLMDQGLDQLRGSGANDYVKNLGDTVKHNPMPTVLIGVGMAWLIASSGRSSKPDYDYDDYAGGRDYDDRDYDTYGRPRGAAYGRAPEPRIYTGDANLDADGDDGDGKVASAARDAKARAGAAAGSVRDGANSAARSVRDGASNASDAVASGARDARDGAQRAARQMSHGARRQARRAGEGWDYMAREQPLALGALGLAIGALCGAGLPSTQHEDDLMGESSDAAKSRAAQVAREQGENARSAAKAAASAASEEAQRQGVHIDSAREQASSATESARKIAEEARRAAEADMRSDSTSRQV